MNPLVVDKIAKRFIYDKDSGFIFTRNTIASLPADWSYTILVPPDVPREFFPADREVRLVPYNYSTSIHQNRYHFNRELLAKCSPYGVDYDVILCNQPEISANLRVFYFNQRREKPIILNFFHWIDCEESRKFGGDLGGYIWRQIDGVLSADMNYFHTPYAKSLFDGELKHKGVSIDYNSGCFNVTPTIFGNEPMELPNKKIILFNHRNNETTGWQEVLQVCTELRKKRDDFVLWFTDDQKIELNNALNSLDFVKVQKVPFENYGYLMQNSHFSVCNLKGYATWNLSVLDSSVNGCTPLVRDSDLMNALFSDAYTFRNADGLLSKMDDMLACSKTDLDPAVLNPVLHTIPISDTILKLVNERLDTKIPSKYYDVKAFIQNRESFPDKTTKFGAELTMKDTKVVYKKDWVNYFWSFHANANFSKIRLRLLSEGIKDDITSVDTKYVYER
jgi:hypothetical protein